MTGDYYRDYKSYVELIATGKKLVLWGAGDKAESVIETFFKSDDIQFIVDSDSGKWGSKLCGVKVVSPDMLCDAPDSYVVLITVKTAFVLSRIYSQLANMKIQYFFPAKILDFANCHTRYDADGKKTFHEFVSYNYVQSQMDSISKVSELLADDKSREIYNIYIEKLKYNIKGYHDITDDLYDHYFSDNIFKYSEEEVFVDGGAFDGGDTIMLDEILALQGKRLTQAYCFEPDFMNWERCKRNFGIYMGESFGTHQQYYAKSERINLYQFALAHRSEELQFVSQGVPSTSIFTSKGDEKILTKTLDEIIGDEKVTFVKFDLEGADYKALLGAKNTILENRPKLALSIYHCMEDLWRIPLYIHELVPEYKLFVRHHNKNMWDKVLYAAVEEDLL